MAHYKNSLTSRKTTLNGSVKHQGFFLFDRWAPWSQCETLLHTTPMEPGVGTLITVWDTSSHHPDGTHFFTPPRWYTLVGCGKSRTPNKTVLQNACCNKIYRTDDPPSYWVFYHERAGLQCDSLTNWSPGFSWCDNSGHGMAGHVRNLHHFGIHFQHFKICLNKYDILIIHDMIWHDVMIWIYTILVFIFNISKCFKNMIF